MKQKPNIKPSSKKPAKKAAVKKPVKKVAATVSVEPVKKGRKPLDVDELLVKIYYDAPKGLNDIQLAALMGISISSFYELKATNSDFAEGIKFYRRISPIEVLKSFKSLACGYSFDEVKKETRRNKVTGEYELVTTEVITKHIPANASAGIFYLKNQMPEQFKDKIEQEHSFAGNLENISFIIKGKNS